MEDAPIDVVFTTLSYHMANKFRSEIFIATDEEQVNAKSILGLLTLAATKGTRISVRAEGEDEGAAVTAIAELLANRFGEDE
jgi:phosphocarrier protein